MPAIFRQLAIMNLLKSCGPLILYDILDVGQNWISTKPRQNGVTAEDFYIFIFM